MNNLAPLSNTNLFHRRPPTPLRALRSHVGMVQKYISFVVVILDEMRLPCVWIVCMYILWDSWSWCVSIFPPKCVLYICRIRSFHLKNQMSQNYVNKERSDRNKFAWKAAIFVLNHNTGGDSSALFIKAKLIFYLQSYVIEQPHFHSDTKFTLQILKRNVDTYYSLIYRVSAGPFMK